MAGAFLHREQEAMTHGQHEHHEGGHGEDPAQHQKPPAPQRVGSQQQKEQQADMERAEGDPTAIGQ